MAQEDAPPTAAADSPAVAENDKKEGADAEQMDPAIVDAVAERLSFFLGDANLRQDLFFRKHMLRSDGPYPRMVKLDVLLNCNTIKQHTKDEKVLIAAAKKLSDQLVVSKDEQAIGRVVPFTKEKMDENIPLSLHVTNLPLSDNETKYEVTPAQIRELFEPYGTVTLVKFRFKFQGSSNTRSTSKKGQEDDFDNSADGAANASPTKGSRRPPLGAAFVEFKTVEELNKAAEDTLTSKDGETIEPKRKLTIGDKTLEVMLMKDFIEKNTKDKIKNGTDAKEGDRKREAEDEDDQEDEEKAAKVFTVDWKPGCVIQLKGLSSSCDRESILDAIAKALDITVAEAKEKKIYADYSRGQEDGAIRFAEPEGVADLCKRIAAGEVEIAGGKVKEATVLEGDAETKYWNDFIAFKNKQKKHKADENNHRRKKQKRYR